ncbi:MAG: 50S ribosomal protein L10, partial [Verrucomicrobiae bacterium]|nr:50S ribosomal protein L10 [Verrucomicrobiae bacterium]
VVKNSLFRQAVLEAGLPDLGPRLTGQLAVVTGQKDISAAAKVLKTFAAEFERPKIKFGYLNDQELDEAALSMLADLPSLDTLRASLLGLLNAPATRLVRVLGAPATQLARVLQARVDKGA